MADLGFGLGGLMAPPPGDPLPIVPLRSAPPPDHHALNGGFTFWILKRQKKGGAREESGAQPGGPGGVTDVEDYEKALKKAGTFNTVEGFWNVYGYLIRPSDKTHGTVDLHLFRSDIRPVWEDPNNKRGGKWVVKIRKGLGARYWEGTILALIGEHFAELSSEICGVVVSIRHGEDVLSLWTRNAADQDALSRVGEMWKKVLRLPAFVPVEYKPHDSAAPSAARPPAWRARPRPSPGGAPFGFEGSGGDDLGGGGGAAWSR